MEYFFVLAGFLERQSLEKIRYQGEKIYKVIGRKFLSVWPIYCISFLMIYCGRIWILRQQGFSIKEGFDIILFNLPELFMIQCLGGECIVNALSWYMSAYFISEVIVIVIFFALGKYEKVLNTVFAVIPLIYYAYCIIFGQSLQQTYQWKSIMYGLSGISLGCIVWKIKEILEEKHFDKYFIGIEQIIVLFLTAASIFTCRKYMGGEYVATAFCALLVISISFNKVSIKNNLANKIISFGGKLSFPFYLVQVFPMVMCQLGYIPLEEFKQKYFPITLLLSVLVLIIDSLLKIIFNKMHEIVKR